jgi:hypothetical protein
VFIHQDGESRIVSWKETSGPLPVTHYNIYRTFTTEIPFNVTLLKPVATISSNEPRPYTWKDTCRTEQRSVRYAVTAVDIAGREHTSDVIISNLLPLVGSFVSNTPIKYPVHVVLDGRFTRVFTSRADHPGKNSSCHWLGTEEGRREYVELPQKGKDEDSGAWAV